MPSADSHFPYLVIRGELPPEVAADTMKLLSHWIGRGGGSDASDFAYATVEAFATALAVLLEIEAPYLESGPQTHIDWHERLATRMASVMEKMADYVEFTGEGGNGRDVLERVREALSEAIRKYPNY